MAALFSNGVFFPAIVLGLAGFFVPRQFARILPEGVKPLLINAFLSTVVLFAVSSLFFFCLYLWQGLSVAQITKSGLATAVLAFGRLGIASALIWLPILILSVAGLPRKWVHATW